MGAFVSRLGYRRQSRLSAGAPERTVRTYVAPRWQAPDPQSRTWLPAVYSEFTKPGAIRQKRWDERPTWWWRYSGVVDTRAGVAVGQEPFKFTRFATGSRIQGARPTPRFGPLRRPIARRQPARRVEEV